MLVHQGFNFFSKCSSSFFLEVLKHSSSCNPECNFFLPLHWRWYYVILDNLSSCFMIHMLSRMRYLNPSLSSLELSCVMLHLKSSRRIVAIYVAHDDPSSSFILPVKKFLVSLFLSFQSIVSVSDRISTQFWHVFHKPT